MCPIGINTHLPSAAELDKVVDAGLTHVRMDFNWWMMQPAPGQWEWATTDRMVQDAAARGLVIYPTLAYAPAWAGGGPQHNGVPTRPEDWYVFVSSVVVRYGHAIHHWGIWNEPNYEHFWAGSLEAYVELVRVARDAVKNFQAVGLVCGPELAMEDDWAWWLMTILQRGGAYFDVITQHTYQDDGRAALRRVAGQPWPWRPTTRSIMEETGHGHKPLWLTETGWDTAEVGEESQASYYDQLLESVADYPIDAVLFYRLTDEPTVHWGVLHPDLSPKPAYGVIQAHLGGGPPPAGVA
jgi:Glycosyl hydrolases family 39